MCVPRASFFDVLIEPECTAIGRGSVSVRRKSAQSGPGGGQTA